MGCVATGVTVEEALQFMKETLGLHLKGMAKDGDELPHAKGLKYYLAQEEPIAQAGDLITYIEIMLLTVA